MLDQDVFQVPVTVMKEPPLSASLTFLDLPSPTQTQRHRQN